MQRVFPGLAPIDLQDALRFSFIPLETWGVRDESPMIGRKNMLRSIWSPVEDEHHRLTSWPRLHVLGSDIPRASFVQRSGSTWKLHRWANSWRHVRAGTWATEPQKSLEQKGGDVEDFASIYGPPIPNRKKGTVSSCRKWLVSSKFHPPVFVMSKTGDMNIYSKGSNFTQIHPDWLLISLQFQTFVWFSCARTLVIGRLVKSFDTPFPWMYLWGCWYPSAICSLIKMLDNVSAVDIYLARPRFKKKLINITPSLHGI